MSKERESIESAIETPSRRVKRSAASVLQEGAAAAPGEPAQARGRLLNTSSGIVSTASTASTISTGRGGLVAGGRGGGRPGMLGVVHMMGPGGGMMMQQPQTQHQPNTSTPCAACKLLRRRCAQECPFAPYFSPHEPQRFASVHKIYGASNVSKMLMEVPESQRADAANSLVYEANARIRDPVYGCMGVISTLQQQAHALQAELSAVRAEVMRYRAAAAASTAAHHVEAAGVVHVLAPSYPDHPHPHPHPHHPHHPAHQRPGGPDHPGHGPFAGASQPSTSQQQPPSPPDTKDRFWS